ncbi:hypothetical protein PRN20_11540 [Devosia sp. ZB163]|uniref:hypothetical protein n=1 Tax=Devosia sp. ZB163 TaxID=3025938 RepID=UPI00236108AC|nr:hypothetical protein [Devosia sp. ZB163]MDC9824367.1 hypothetical protein [Devosia sp. ZB163]
MATDHIPLSFTRSSRPGLRAAAGRLWNALLVWLSEPVEAEADPLSHLTPRDWADIPAHHPRHDG